MPCAVLWLPLRPFGAKSQRTSGFSINLEPGKSLEFLFVYFVSFVVKNKPLWDLHCDNG